MICSLINSGNYHIPYLHSFSRLPPLFQIPATKCATHALLTRLSSTHRHISLHNTPIHIKPITIVNNPLKACSAPLYSPAADNSFPVKHCYICDESPITPIVSYNPTPYPRKFHPQRSATIRPRTHQLPLNRPRT